MWRFIFSVGVIVFALAGDPIAWTIIVGWAVFKLARGGHRHGAVAHRNSKEAEYDRVVYEHELRHKNVANALGYRAKIRGDETIVDWKKNTPPEHRYAVFFAGSFNEPKWAWKSDRKECNRILQTNKADAARIKREGERLAARHH